MLDRYGDAFSYPMDPSEPFLGLAMKYFVNSEATEGVRGRARLFAKLAEEYKLDGMIFHSNRCCRFLSPSQMDIMNYLNTEIGLPCLMFEADMADPRQYSDLQVKARIDSFLEILESRRARAS